MARSSPLSSAGASLPAATSSSTSEKNGAVVKESSDGVEGGSSDGDAKIDGGAAKKDRAVIVVSKGANNDGENGGGTSADAGESEGVGGRADEQNDDDDVAPRILARGTVTVAYCSTTGTCKGFASRLRDELDLRVAAATKSRSRSKSDPGGGGVPRRAQLIRVSEVDWWDELLNDEEEEEEIGVTEKNPPVLLLVLPTWTNGTLPPDSQVLLDTLAEISSDWRVSPDPLRKCGLRVGAFGMGSSAYDASTVGKPARTAFGTLVGRMAARPVIMGRKDGSGRSIRGNSLAVGDDEVGDANVAFERWMGGALDAIFDDGSSGVRNGGGRGRKKGKQLVKGKVKKRGKKPKGGDVDGGKEGGQSRAEDPSSSGCACKEGETKKGSDGEAGGCCSSGGGAATGGTNDENTGCCSSGAANEDDENAGCCSSGTSKEDDSLTAPLTNEELSNEDLSNEEFEEDDSDDGEEDDYDPDEPEIVDLEDMGNAMMKTPNSSSEPKEMVTPKQAKALKKEGYKLIGTHSAVKLCRWTKHQLRGRGGCYKHTHYGITSYQCMEATPSLACANKCVFCWRHHKNPVGKEWRWKTDDPHMIVEEAVKEHVGMIKETRGIPGIRMDRWRDAHTVKHCALSLVGEPIMYPRINDLLTDLHSRKISTFLVTNGQHPGAIRDLVPVTQLYVSVDASNPEDLEAIDRPLFRDAWDRLGASLSCLKDRGQRTVARITVVKGWNSGDLGGYARLIAKGRCSLVEVKGVTFCGKSDASNLNMSNSPWHHEVIGFSRLLMEELAVVRREDLAAAEAEKGGGPEAEKGEKKYGPLPEYGLACEHKHSCSVLLARKDQFYDPAGKWRTWIDYEKFSDLIAQQAADPSFTFGVADYVADTPPWAVFGAEEEGFDPTDMRHRKKTKHPKYTRFDVTGVPTHDEFEQSLDEEEVDRLRSLMDAKRKETGIADDCTVMTELKGGEKRIEDPSLMFRGMVVSK